jgi:hypothetical protein
MLEDVTLFWLKDPNYYWFFLRTHRRSACHYIKQPRKADGRVQCRSNKKRTTHRRHRFGCTSYKPQVCTTWPPSWIHVYHLAKHPNPPAAIEGCSVLWSGNVRRLAHSALARESMWLLWWRNSPFSFLSPRSVRPPLATTLRSQHSPKAQCWEVGGAPRPSSKWWTWMDTGEWCDRAFPWSWRTKGTKCASAVPAYAIGQLSSTTDVEQAMRAAW